MPGKFFRSSKYTTNLIKGFYDYENPWLGMLHAVFFLHFTPVPPPKKDLIQKKKDE
jgi:hypothetical protein